MDDKETKIEETLAQDIRNTPQLKKMQLRFHVDGVGLFLYGRNPYCEIMGARAYINNTSDETINRDLAEIVKEVEKLHAEGYDIIYDGPKNYDEYFEREAEISAMSMRVLSIDQFEMVSTAGRISNEISRIFYEENSDEN